MKKSNITQLPIIFDDRGNLTFIENNNQLPFSIKRVYWIYNVPGGKSRGGHAYHKMNEIIIALSGSFKVELDNGKKKTEYVLNRSYNALYIPNMTWRTVREFSTNSLALLISDSLYDENDYIRNYDEFINIKSQLDV